MYSEQFAIVRVYEHLVYFRRQRYGKYLSKVRKSFKRYIKLVMTDVEDDIF